MYIVHGIGRSMFYSIHDTLNVVHCVVPVLSAYIML